MHYRENYFDVIWNPRFFENLENPKRTFTELSRNFSQISIQNGGNWPKQNFFNKLRLSFGSKYGQAKYFIQTQTRAGNQAQLISFWTQNLAHFQLNFKPGPILSRATLNIGCMNLL
jgi:hypothetical protein